ncbi:NADH-quinone oxidoreductase subunit A [Sinimarinibacterium sp. NLF-5-8]|uniref:NADH-quinone oxidoreductase subunit A n=1 Tax=Sinimarinibacterium sp. NLF-5-8 TaxID=2698684 RepID=UPI00137BC9B8|nr:NADH-quinone oxidoreductase subunit A [Sinimarinibacterium sp. NLF-5-8]QHS10233.1 NAD(P)H-quinone oxidoreductase subunit 3 [Sinimarinibacterium sp. NLF-5-8]
MDVGQLVLYSALVFGLVIAMLGLSWMLGPRTQMTQATLDTYESGIISTGGARYRMSAKFYLMAVLFVVFDLEVAYVLAWGVAARETGWAGYIEILVFLSILFVALLYLWRTGAMEWAPRGQRAADRRY